MLQSQEALKDVGPYQQLFGAYSNPPRVLRPYDDSKFSKSAEKLCLHILAAFLSIWLIYRHCDRCASTSCRECMRLQLPNSADLRRILRVFISAVGLRSVVWMHQMLFNCKVCGQLILSMKRCDDTPATRQRHVTL